MTHKIKIITISLFAALMMAVVVASTIHLSTTYLDQQYAESHQGCSPAQIDHQVTIQNGALSPANFTGAKCDTLTVTNLDDTRRMIAFGLHDSHVPYDGIEEQSLVKGQSFTVTLVQPGAFRFHDHLHDEVQGTFTVNN